MNDGDKIRVLFDSDKRAFTFLAARNPALGILSSVLALEANGALLRADEAVTAECEGLRADGEIGKGERAVMVFTFAQPAIVWRVEASVTDDGGSALLGSRITNESDR